MTSLLTALFLLQPALAPGLQAPPDKHCYYIRIFPIPKDFRDRIEIPSGQAPARLEEVRPNCWAAPSPNLIREDRAASAKEPARKTPPGNR